jgi:hypothetical protein
VAAIADALTHNKTLLALDLCGKQIGSNGIIAIAHAFKMNKKPQ